MFIKEINQEEYDKLYANSHFSFLQSSQWGKVKKADGYTPRYFAIRKKRESAEIGAFMVLSKKFSLFGEQAYVPRPLFLFNPDNMAEFDEVFEALAQLGKSFGVILIDPDIPFRIPSKIVKKDSNKTNEKLAKLAIKNGFSLGKNIQPRKSLFVDLKQTEEKWFTSMRKSARKEIRRALKQEEKGNISVQLVVDERMFDKCVSAIEKYSQAEFYARGKEYYLRMRKAFGQGAAGFAVIVKGEYVGGAVGVIDRNAGCYRAIYSGISREALSKFKAGYLVKYHQWTEAKKMGLKWLDLWGVEDDPKHPWYGFSRFKLGFGGRVVEYPKQIQIFRNFFVKFGYKVYRRLRTAS